MNKNIYILFIALAVGFTACKDNKEVKVSAVQLEKNSVSFNQDQLKQLTIQSIDLVPIAEEFTAVGEVSFDEDNVVRVYPIVSGSVYNVDVSLGD